MQNVVRVVSNVIIINVFIIIITLLCSKESASQTAQRIILGARPIAMGEAFTAVADDGNALFWNPAGLSGLKLHELKFNYAEPYSFDIEHKSAQVIYPFLEQPFTLSLQWANVSFDEKNIFTYSKNNISVSGGYTLWNKLSLGGSVKALMMNMSLDEETLGRGSGYGFDAGLLLAPCERLKLGLMAKDIFDTKLRYKGDGNSETFAPRMLTVGASLSPLKNSVIAFDYDSERWHAGGEYWIQGDYLKKTKLSLRMGIQDELKIRENPIYSFGFGIQSYMVTFDYAFVSHPSLHEAHYFTISFKADFRKPNVIIKDYEFKEIFPAIHRHYQREPIGHVVLQNLNYNENIDTEQDEDDLTQKVDISISIPEYLKHSSSKLDNIPVLSEKKVYLNGFFSNKILNRTEEDSITCELKVKSSEKFFSKIYTQNVKIRIHNRNSIIWGNNTYQVGAFITSNDPIIERFASKVHRYHKSDFKKYSLSNEKLLTAIAIFNALQQMDIIYKKDPNYYYTNSRQDGKTIDDVKYPAQTLIKGDGDCEDLTVLYCALLEQLGINTAIIDVGNHIFMMFDTRIKTQEKYINLLGFTYKVNGNFFYNPKSEEKEKYFLWIPLEMTMIESSFMNAWQNGARNYLNIKNKEIINVTDAWEEYKQTVPDFTWDKSIPNAEELQPTFADELIAVVNTILADRRISISNLIDRAELFLKLQKYDLCIAECKKILDEKTIARIYLIMGKAYLGKNEFQNMARSFKKAKEVNPNDSAVIHSINRELQKLPEEERDKYRREIENEY